MAKKNKSTSTMVGAPDGHDKEDRKRAMERYANDYGFKRGIRPQSPDRDSYSYDGFESRVKLNEHFYGVRDPREIKMMLAKPHNFGGARTAQEGKSVYRKFPNKGKKGHRIGAR